MGEATTVSVQLIEPGRRPTTSLLSSSSSFSASTASGFKQADWVRSRTVGGSHRQPAVPNFSNKFNEVTLNFPFIYFTLKNDITSSSSSIDF
jgi:hypothetical protein